MSMHVDHFRQYQREAAAQNLFSLVSACRRRFLSAAHLLELKSPAIQHLEGVGSSTPAEIWPLLKAHDALCERYIELFFSSQTDLFSTAGDSQDMKWSKYYHHLFVPHVVRNDELVRTILRACRALPCRKPDEVASALATIFSEMTLPDTSPPWDATLTGIEE